jgi:large subunit ribosomal protein L15
MNLSSLKPKAGSVKNRKRLGRGPGSGLGKTSGKGHKGQKSRSGYKSRAWSEGGQMPIQRRLPKRGFTNIFRKEFQVVNLSQLVKAESDEITPEVLLKKGIVNKKNMPIKILGNGDLDRALNVKADAFTKSAIEKIEKAGGKAEKLIPKTSKYIRVKKESVKTTAQTDDSPAE